MNDIIGSHFQGPVETHSPERCTGQSCVIHSPSDHPLKDAPIYFRTDWGYLAERVCSHGNRHPDPDSVAYFDRIGVEGMGVHSCDGCCRKP